jgi:hypothetical protein
MSNNLDDLAHKINVCATKSDDYRVTAACHLAEAKALCKRDGVAFKAWVEANIKFSYDEARKLAVCGESGDPAKAIADMRAGSKARVEKSRAVQRSTAVERAIKAEGREPKPKPENNDVEVSEEVEDPALVLADALDTIDWHKAVAEAYRKIFKVSSFDREAKEQIRAAIKKLIIKWRTVDSALDNKPCSKCHGTGTITSKKTGTTVDCDCVKGGACAEDSYPEIPAFLDRSAGGAHA